MRRKKVKIPPKIPCAHCSAFQNSKRLLDGGRLRFCKFLQQDIYLDELHASSCPGFEASNYFWCEKHQQRLTVSICIRRKENKTSECRRCKIHEIVLEVKKRENGQVVNSWRKKPCSEPVAKNLGEIEIKTKGE